MRITILYFILVVLCWSCKSKEPTSIIVSVLADKTDSLIPSPQVAHIKPFFEDDGTVDGKRIFRFQTITNTNVNTAYKAELKARSVLGNSLQRKADVFGFYRQIDTLLNQKNDFEKQYHNSSIIIPLLEQLKRVNESNANRKILLLYSDIFEASDVFNIYSLKDKRQLLYNRETVIADFRSQFDVPQLDGVELYIIYYPRTMNENRLFDAMSLLYRELFKNSGLKIHIGIDNPLTP